MKHIRKTNPQILKLISDLKSKSREKDVALWRDIAIRIERPTKNYPEVNISRINRYSKPDDVIIVPGKVLGAGDIDHKITVSALKFSKNAKNKITKAGGSCISIKELMEQNLEASNIRIFG